MFVEKLAYLLICYNFASLRLKYTYKISKELLMKHNRKYNKTSKILF